MLADRQTHRQIDKQTDRQTDRNTPLRCRGGVIMKTRLFCCFIRVTQRWPLHVVIKRHILLGTYVKTSCTIDCQTVFGIHAYCSRTKYCKRFSIGLDPKKCNWFRQFVNSTQLNATGQLNDHSSRR